MFRQVDQRHVSSEIAFMEWSPTMDLIALATVQGEVLLHRLSWQKVWSLPSPGNKDEEIKITSLAWRPDGKVLAVAYDTGKIVLVDIENAELLHTIRKDFVATSMHWVECKALVNEDTSNIYTDHSSLFLPKGYSLAKNYGSSSKPTDEDNDDFKKLCTEDLMSILVFGTQTGSIHLYAFGIFPCGCIQLNEADGKDPRALSVHLSQDMNMLTLVIQSVDHNNKASYRLKSFDVSVLKKKAKEYKVVAMKYGQISFLLACLQSTIHDIHEAWEDILLEIDTKLLNYAKEKKRISDGTVSDDFLELLMFGTPSDPLEKFLLHDLTENGLKKFGHSIELSYSNIQKLVLKKLQNVALSLYYYLSDLKGISLWVEKFEELGLSYEDVKASLSATGSFLLKATEVQQVIDSSMKNFKAFFRWLYAVILRLSDEPVPAEITKITQQDLNFVAEFLKENFTNDWDLESKATFKLERVGQYLKDENLQFPPNVSGNPWINFLKEHPSLKESDLIFQHFPENSLVQQFNIVSKAVGTAFHGPPKVFPNYIQERNTFVLFTHDVILENPILLHSTCVNDSVITVFANQCLPVEQIYILQESVNKREDVKTCCLTFKELCNGLSNQPNQSADKYRIYRTLDLKFYNDDFISILLVEKSSDASKIDYYVLSQLPLSIIFAEMKLVNAISEGICSNIPSNSLYVDKTGHKQLENIKAVEIAVSGSRKVACVLFASRRQVRLFETEVGDEDEDPDDTEQEDSIMKELSDKDEPMNWVYPTNDKENSACEG